MRLPGNPDYSNETVGCFITGQGVFMKGLMMIPIRHLIASCALITILSGCRSIQRYGVSGSVLDAESGKPLKNDLVMVAYASIWEEYPNVTVELKFQRTNHNGKFQQTVFLQT